MNSVRENFVCALRALQLNWLRSLLTMSGIIVGVMSIVTLVAILQGVKVEISKQVEGLGANLVLIVPSKLDENGQLNPGSMIGISSLTEKDVEVLRKVPGVATISPVSIVSGAVALENGKTSGAFVVAANRDGVVMNPNRVVAGRYFNDDEGYVCILSDKPRRELFGDRSPIGQTVRILEKNWKVVGVLEKPESDGSLGSAMLGLSTLVYLPVSTVRRAMPNGQINRIALQTDYKHNADNMIESLEAALRKSHGVEKGSEDFGVLTQKRGLALVIKVLNMTQALLVLIAAISLFVAGVGIMNIMLVTVTERTREVGIRKTVGARRSDIFLQFLTEAVILSILGGGVGLAFSAILCTLIAQNSPLTPLITPGVIVMALTVCICVGALFGVTPAVRAARLHPIDALRYE